MEQAQKLSFQLRLLNNSIKRRITNLAPPPPCEAATVLHGMIVLFLAEQDERAIFQKDVESEFHIRRSTASVVLRLMEKNGLIRREAVPEDARLKRLILTDQAKQLHRQMESLVWHVDKELSQGIPREEMEVFLGVLQKMQENMERASLQSPETGGAAHI